MNIFSFAAFDNFKEQPAVKGEAKLKSENFTAFFDVSVASADFRPSQKEETPDLQESLTENSFVEPSQIFQNQNVEKDLIEVPSETETSQNLKVNSTEILSPKDDGVSEKRLPPEISVENFDRISLPKHSFVETRKNLATKLKNASVPVSAPKEEIDSFNSETPISSTADFHIRGETILENSSVKVAQIVRGKSSDDFQKLQNPVVNSTEAPVSETSIINQTEILTPANNTFRSFSTAEIKSNLTVADKNSLDVSSVENFAADSPDVSPLKRFVFDSTKIQSFEKPSLLKNPAKVFSPVQNPVHTVSSAEIKSQFINFNSLNLKANEVDVKSGNTKISAFDEQITRRTNLTETSIKDFPASQKQILSLQNLQYSADFAPLSSAEMPESQAIKVNENVAVAENTEISNHQSKDLAETAKDVSTFAVKAQSEPSETEVKSDQPETTVFKREYSISPKEDTVYAESTESDSSEIKLNPQTLDRKLQKRKLVNISMTNEPEVSNVTDIFSKPEAEIFRFKQTTENPDLNLPGGRFFKSKTSNSIDKFNENISIRNVNTSEREPAQFEPEFKKSSVRAAITEPLEMKTNREVFEAETVEMKISKSGKKAEIAENDFSFNFDKFLTSAAKQSKTIENAPKTPFENHRIFEQVEPQVLQIISSMNIENEKKSMKMRLHPAELGAIEIKLEKNAEGKIVAHFQTETEATRQNLAQNIEHLRDSLQNAGWQVEQLDVTCQQFSPNGGDQNANHSQTEKIERQSEKQTAVGRDSEEKNDLKPNELNRLLSVHA